VKTAQEKQSESRRLIEEAKMVIEKLIEQEAKS